MHGSPKSSRRNRRICRRKSASLKSSAIALYSVSFEESAVHFVREICCIAAPPYMTTPTTAPLEGNAVATRDLQIRRYPSRGLPAFGLGGMYLPCDCPHGIRDVKSRVVNMPHQTPSYQLTKWLIPIGLIVKLLKNGISRKGGVLTCDQAKLLVRLFRETLM